MKQISVPVGAALQGRLVRRYKRFFADIETADGRTLTVHCPNPGSMRGTDREGAMVRCSHSDNPKRKLAHTLEMIRVGRVWVGLHTLRANQLAGAMLDARAIPELGDYANARREVKVGEGSRLDFVLEAGAGGAGADRQPQRPEQPHYIEVKSVTMAEGALARFPDAVTERGRRHMETLAKLVSQGARATLLFVVQRGDSTQVAPADDIDPLYGEALRAAVADGVRVLAVGARVTARAIHAERMLPVVL